LDGDLKYDMIYENHVWAVFVPFKVLAGASFTKPFFTDKES